MEQGWKRRRERRSKSRSRERSTKRRYARQLRARRRAHERRKKYRMALRRARIANARRRERRWKKNKKEKSYKLWRRARARARRAKERARKYLRSKKRALERRSKYWNERRKKRRVRERRKKAARRRWILIRRRAAEKRRKYWIAKRRATERRLKKMSKEKAAKILKKLRERRAKWRRRMRIRRERRHKYKKERKNKRAAHARRVKAWRREKKIKARARERTRKSKIRALRWAAERRSKERKKKRTRGPKIGCKTANERIAKNAVSYLGRSWCDTFRSCPKSTGRRNRRTRTWIKGQAYKEYTGTCADHRGRAVNRRFARRWSIHATFAWCKAKCDAMGPNCAGISMSSKVHRDPNAMPNYWKNARYAVGWLRKNSRKVLSWKRKGRKARRVRRVVKTSWHVKGLQCKTARVSSNRAGVIRARQWRGWTMVGGGINNHYRHFNKLSAFEESYPEGNNWRCDTGFGPGRLTCYSRMCRLSGMSCPTRSAHKNGSGIIYAHLPAGYTATGGGVYNHYRHFNKHSAFETSIPHGNRSWRCDMGLGHGRFNCYVRGCRATHNKRLHCITRTSRSGNWHNVQCPGGYSVTGCGQNEQRRQWNHLSGFEEMRVHGNGCVRDSGFGGGRNACYTRCCKMQVRRL